MLFSCTQKDSGAGSKGGGTGNGSSGAKEPAKEQAGSKVPELTGDVSATCVCVGGERKGPILGKGVDLAKAIADAKKRCGLLKSTASNCRAVSS